MSHPCERCKHIDETTEALLSDMLNMVRLESAKWLEAAKQFKGPSILKPGELAKLADTVIKLDRLVKGESTVNIASEHHDLSELSLDELRTLQALTQKVEGNGIQ